jgi:hypothetical protein
MKRPLCQTCNLNLAAINYHSNGKTRYRKLCDICLRKGKKLKPVPAWYKAGFRKKPVCDKCGFRAKYPDRQMSVFYLDGNLKNNNEFNLKTVCLNCRVELQQSGSAWRESPITPDF